MASFTAEIKRRKVFQVAAVYVATAWLILQVVSIIEEPLRLPATFDTAVIVALVIGFPVALVLAWAFELTPDGIKTAAVAGESDSAAAAGGWRSTYVAAGLFAAALGLLLIDRFVLNEAGNASVNQVRRIAILPCEDLSPDPTNAFFSPGFHQELVDQLGVLETIDVISRSSVMRYAGSRPPVPQIAQERDVDAVMECSVRYAGENVRISVTLFDGASDADLWSQTYLGNLSDIENIFSQQVDIARNIASAYEAELTPGEVDRLSYVKTSSGEAYAFYLRALQARETGGNAAALSFLDNAIELDPNFAEAIGFRAYLYASILLNPPIEITVPEIEGLPPRELADLITREAQRALDVDENASSAYRALANMNAALFERERSAELFRRAIEVNPKDQISQVNYMLLLANTGGIDEALARFEQFQRSFPIENGFLYAFFSQVILASGDIERYETFVRDALEDYPSNAQLHERLAIAHLLRGDPNAAAAELSLANELLGRRNVTEAVYSYVAQAYLYHRAGLDDDAQELFAEFRRYAGDREVGALSWALGYLAVDDRANALEQIEAAVDRIVAGHGDNVFAAATLSNNFYADPVLELPEFRSARQRLNEAEPP